ncbi:MAG: hypothetical protein EBU31_08395 [Proteobacteria bacterium]|nr:hypothetical protein [Pseudomonadota bacterium]
MAAVAVTLTQASSAAMVTFTNASLWTFFATSRGATTAAETFNSYSGNYAGGATGSVGGIQWQANAPGGVVAGAGFLATQSSDTVLTFSMSPSVQGVAGNFFASDGGPSFNAVPAIISVVLNDGTSYIGYAASAADFVGFYSTGAAISSVAVSVAGNAFTGSYYATADNLYFAVVPAPGAVALIAVAGLVGSRRRR